MANETIGFEGGLAGVLPERAHGDTLVMDASAYQVAVAERNGQAAIPPMVDMMASPAAYSYLRQLPEWYATNHPDRLEHRSASLRIERGGEQHARFLGRSWKSELLGTYVMGMPDVCARAQDRSDEAGTQLAEDMRHWLHNPELPPLPDHMLVHQRAEIDACLPEHVVADPEAPRLLRLAANGMHTVCTLYGDRRIGRANQIIGELELAEYRVPALYHNGYGLVQDVRELAQHYTWLGLSSRHILLGVAADTNSDAVYGNGRKSDNPTGYDELRSANLLAAHATWLGLDRPTVRRMRRIVLGTTFDEETKQQVGIGDEDELVRGGCGIDLQTLARIEGVTDSWDVAGENGFSARFSEERIIGRVLAPYGYRITSIEQLVEAMDNHAGERPVDAPHGPTVKEAFARGLLGSGHFIATHRFPHDWMADNWERRQKHAGFLKQIANRLLGDPAFALSRAYAHSLAYTASLAPRL